MPDRIREPELTRTPTQDIPDSLNMFGAQQDIADFAPTMKGGVDVSEGALTFDGEENLLHNGSFEDGIDGWNDITGTLSSDESLFTDGVASAKMLPDGVSTDTYYNGSIFDLPANASALRVSAEMRVAAVTTPMEARLIIDFYDADSVQVGAQWYTVYAPLTAAFQTFAGQCRVPAGAARARMSVRTTAATAPGVLEAIYTDNCIVTNLPTLDSVHHGTGAFEHGIHGLMADSVSLTDEAFASTIGTYQEWGTSAAAERVRFVKDATWDGLSLTIEVNAYGRVSNTAAAQRSINARLDLSYNDGASWDAGYVFQYNIGATGGHNNIAVAWGRLSKVLAANVTTAITARVMWAQTNGAISETVTHEGYVIVKMFPGRQ